MLLSCLHFTALIKLMSFIHNIPSFHLNAICIRRNCYSWCEIKSLNNIVILCSALFKNVIPLIIVRFSGIWCEVPRRGYGTLPWWRGLRESRTTATIPKTFNDIGKAQSETPDEDHVQPNPSNSHWASAEGMAHPFLSWVTPKNQYRPFLLGQRI